jgi:hypothetical protein
MWGNPWLPKVKNLKRTSGCPKCVNKYEYSASEKMAKLNNKASGFRVSGFVDKHSNTGKCLVICDKHGSGCSFTKPWRPSISNIIKGSGCPKCANDRAPKESDLNNKVTRVISGSSLTFLGFDDFSMGTLSKLSLSCNIHGHCEDWGNPWKPTLRHLKVGTTCLKYSGYYIETKDEVFDKVKQYLSRTGTLKLVDIVKEKGARHYEVLECFGI